MQNFTDAVKAIVNVPKNDVVNQDTHKLDHKYEEWKCPDCGKTYIKPTQHRHDD